MDGCVDGTTQVLPCINFDVLSMLWNAITGQRHVWRFLVSQG